jgi:multiple sugar transport system permease protein
MENEGGRVNKKGYLKLILPTIIVYSLVTLVPIAYLIYSGLHKTSMYTPGISEFVGLANYKNLLMSGEFWRSIKFTLLFTIGSVVIEFILGFAIALLFNRTFFGIRFSRSILIIPMVIAPILVALTWKMAYDPGFGIINYLLSLVGIEGPAWLSDANTAVISIILVDVWQWTPYMFFVLTSGLQSIPEDYYEAAKIDGASSIKSFIHITIPMLQKVMMIALIFRTMGVFRSYDVIYGLTGGGPGDATTNTPFYAYKLTFLFDSIGPGAAVCILLLLFIAVICYSLSRYLGEIWRTEPK